MLFHAIESTYPAKVNTFVIAQAMREGKSVRKLLARWRNECDNASK